MTKKSVTEIVGTIVDELTPLSSEDRQRIIQASLMLLGEAQIKPVKNSADNAGDGDVEAGKLPARAQSWLKQHGLSMEQIHEVFHWADEKYEVLPLEIPGKNYREKVQNAYVLFGIAQLLTSGEAKFDDNAARALCKDSNIYDETNHTKYMKAKEFRGAKDKGWNLTIPGLNHGAALVTELTKTT